MKLLHRARRLPFLLVLLLAACMTPAQTPTTLSQQAPGTARLLFYRPFSFQGPSGVLTLSLNNNVIGTLPRNSAIYRDVAPGTYTLTFSPTRSAPNQFATVTVGPGSVSYIKIDALPQRLCTGGRLGGGNCDIAGFTSMVMDPATAARELQAVQLLRG